MKRRKVLSSLALPLGAWFWPRRRDSAREATPASTTTGDWPQYGYDAANRGYTRGAAVPPADPELSWTYDPGTQTMNSSPVVRDGVVYAIGTGDPGRLVALDPTGEERWTVEFEGFADTSPVAGEATVYVATWNGVTAYDSDTGEETWHLPLTHRVGPASPTLAGGTLYVATSGDEPLLVDGSADEASVEPPAVIAIEPDSGEEQWRYDDFGDRDSIDTTPAVVDGRVVFANEGTVHALDASSGDPLWQRETGSHAELAPTIVDETVIVGGRDEEGAGAVALDAESGDENWWHSIEANNVRVSPAVADGVVYAPATYLQGCPAVTGTDCESESWGRLYAIDLEGGEELWTVDLQADTRSAPAVAGDTIYVGNGDGLSAVSTDGEKLWHLPFWAADEDSGYVKSSPAVAAEHVFLGASDGQLRAVPLDDGSGSGSDGRRGSDRGRSRGGRGFGPRRQPRGWFDWGDRGR